MIGIRRRPALESPIFLNQCIPDAPERAPLPMTSETGLLGISCSSLLPVTTPSRAPLQRVAPHTPPT